MSDSKAKLNIEITSDTVCPWCFVGKRRLEKALAKLDPNKVDVSIQWKPFYLDPTLPEQSIDKLARYKAKFGEEQVQAMLPRMAKVGKAEGIKFSFSGRTGNTTNSHRLIDWATKQGKQDQIVEQLFKFYFEQERDITDLNTLAEAAEAVGLDKSKAIVYLQSNEGRDEILCQVQEAYSKGISGVPSFNIDNRFQFSGAQDPEFFLHIFGKLGLM